MPALIGPGMFLITPIFILGLIVYSQNWKVFIFQVIPFVLAAEFFSGMNVGKILVPMIITGLLYMWSNKFLNLTERFKENITLPGIISSALFLAMLGYVYSWFFIYLNTSYNIGLAWGEWRLFFIGSLISMLGWSLALSVIFKYVLKTK